MAPTPVLAGALALVLVTAGCLGAVQSPGAQGASLDSTDDSTIAVSATGTAEADPDLALVRVAVETRGDTAEQARAGAADAADGVRDALDELGVDGDAVRTTGFSIRAEYDFRGEERELIGYRAVHAFEVEAGVDEAGAVIDAAVAGGATRVDGVSFTLTEATRSDLRQQALTEAIVSARDDADTIASAAGVRVSGLHSASTGSPGVVPVDVRFAEAASEGGQPTTIDAGPVTVTASVSVVYAVE